MLDESSIEALKDKIFSPITAEYFREVYSCYINSNYRSAIVMLWSVVVLDTVEKLQTLKAMYQDPVAITILDSIDNLKEEDPKASAWELKLIDEVCKKTGLMDRSEFIDLKHIQQQRHLSAHPILKGKTELHTPNKDTTRALIRNALEIILIKPPVYASKILENIQADLDENGHLFTSSDTEEFRRYLNTKYFERMNIETKLKIFRTYWKFVMHLDNEKTRKTLHINHMLLTVIALDNLPEVQRRIERDQDYYSKVRSDKSVMEPMAAFLSKIPSVYNLLTPDTKILIKKAVESRLELCIVSYFKEDTLQAHHKYLQNHFKNEYCSEAIPYEIWERLRSVSDSNEMDREFLKTLSVYYSQSPTYDAADRSSNNILRFIEYFDIPSFKQLLELAEENCQTYDRSRAYGDYAKIKERILELDSSFDFGPYPGFRSA